MLLEPLKFFTNLRDEGVSWSFLKGISKEGSVNTRKALINTKVPLDAIGHSLQQQEATPPV